MPAAGSAGRIYLVTDGNSATDCATGGGSTKVICIDNGSAWEGHPATGGAAFLLSTLSGAQTVMDGTDASTAWTWSLSGGTDPVLTFANNSVTISVPLTATSFVSSGSGAGEVRLLEDSSNGTNYMAFSAPAAVTTTTDLVLPDGDGSSGQHLETNASGTLSWATQRVKFSDGINGTTTQSITFVTLGTITLPANTLTTGDSVKCEAIYTTDGTTDDHRFKVLFGATDWLIETAVGGADQGDFVRLEMQQQATSDQTGYGLLWRDSNNALGQINISNPTEDESGAIAIAFQARFTSGTPVDTIKLEVANCQVFRNAD